ncbi:MAG TPA: hypothetical protein VH478_16090 [Trebonia sp.]|nr:hypothetical protein [Trebonia sp.]
MGLFDKLTGTRDGDPGSSPAAAGLGYDFSSQDITSRCATP